MNVSTPYLSTSGAVQVVSAPIPIADLGNYFIGVSFTGGGGDLAGTLTLEVSATESFARFWVLTGSSQAVTASAGKYWDQAATSVRYVRVRWVPSGGTGTIVIDYTIRQPILTRGG